MQSADINQGVDRSSPEEQGAGDQGMMFGYATNETENHALALDLSHKLLRISYFKTRKQRNHLPRPDAKSVTLEYSDDNKPTRIMDFQQHDDFDEEEVCLLKSKKIFVEILIPELLQNPTSAHLFNDAPTLTQQEICYWWTTRRYRINR
jgi:S-adenosylmethionine synthetase